MLIRSRHGFALAAVVLGVVGVPAAASAAHHVTVHAPRRPVTYRLTLFGLATRVDTVTGTLVINVASGTGHGAAALVGTNVTLAGAGAQVQISGVRGTATLANINVGDRIRADVVSGPTGIVANRIVDTGPPPPPPPPRRRPGYWAFDGTVASVSNGTVLVTVTQVFGAPAAYVGKQVQFTTSAATRVRVVGVLGAGVGNLADIGGGDSVGVYVAAPRTAPAAGASLPAVQVSDFARASTTTTTTTSSSTSTSTSTTTSSTSTSTPTTTSTTTTTTATPTTTSTTTSTSSTTSKVFGT